MGITLPEPEAEITVPDITEEQQHDIETMFYHTLEVQKKAFLTRYYDPDPKPSPYDLSDFRIFNVIGEGSFGKVVLISMKDDPEEMWAMKLLYKEKVVMRKQVRIQSSFK
jgi:hypothetical protein